MDDAGDRGIRIAKSHDLQSDRQAAGAEPRQREAGRTGQRPENLKAAIAGVVQSDRRRSGSGQGYEPVGPSAHRLDVPANGFLPAIRSKELLARNFGGFLRPVGGFRAEPVRIAVQIFQERPAPLVNGDRPGDLVHPDQEVFQRGDGGIVFRIGNCHARVPQRADRMFERIGGRGIDGRPCLGAEQRQRVRLVRRRQGARAVEPRMRRGAADQFGELCKADIWPRLIFGVTEKVADEDIVRVVDQAVRTFMARYGV